MLHAVVLAAALAFKGVVVVRHANGVEEPVYGALVVVDRFTALTSIDGSFEIDGVPPGTYAISVKSNAGSMGGDVVVPETIEPRKLIVLDPTCWAIYGKVRDADRATPIAAATVNYLGSAKTDVNGNYFINWGCSSGPGFRFHNSFFFSVSAPRYVGFSSFGGRAEGVSGVYLRDFVLAAVSPERSEPLRPPRIP